MSPDFTHLTSSEIERGMLCNSSSRTLPHKNLDFFLRSRTAKGGTLFAQGTISFGEWDPKHRRPVMSESVLNYNLIFLL